MASKWNNVLTSTVRSPAETEQPRRRYVPDKVYNMGDSIRIILNLSEQPYKVTLRCREKKPIRFTYEEFMKFFDFVHQFMNKEEFAYGVMDCAAPKCFDFVIGQNIFLSCWNLENNCGLALQDTNNNEFVTWNDIELQMFLSHKYMLYEFLSK